MKNNSVCVWADNYTGSDLGRYTTIYDHHMPTTAGWIIPHHILHDLFLTERTVYQIQQLKDMILRDSSSELQTGRQMVEQVIASVRIPGVFRSAIVAAYEHLADHERVMRHAHTTHLNKAQDILTHIYHPPTVSLSTLPVPDHSMIASGEASLIDALKQVLIDYISTRLHHHGPITVPSVLIRRLPRGEYVGICNTTDSLLADRSLLMISAHHGSLRLDEAADIYTVNKSTLAITSRHILTQPYQMVLRGNGYAKTALHESVGAKANLTDETIQRIADVARDIEKKLYFPHSIEWSIEKGEIFVMEVKKI
ncbi:MAG: PEP/pyruvate-binding domain-containing protein [Candidatus Roizmanbacteria bacterium]